MIGLIAALALSASAPPPTGHLTAAPAATQARRKAKRRAAAGTRRARSVAQALVSDVYFRSCAAARAAGYSRMRVGEPGYSRRLDRDGDGVACE